MRLQLMSDLHLEFYWDKGRRFVETLDPHGVDVLVLAGDIHVPASVDHCEQTLRWFTDKFAHVVYVPGNHEYWRKLYSDADEMIVKACNRISNLTLLRTGVIDVIHGRRFIGDTLWFPYSVEAELYAKHWSDFQEIRGLALSVFDRNKQFRKWFRAAARPGDIVVTHHLPHPGSVADKYKGEASNAYFLSDMSKAIQYARPAMWLHGHTHTPCHYTVGDTRIVANPRGYPGSGQIKSWDPYCILEVHK